MTERSAREDMATVFQRLQSLLLSLDDTQTFLQQMTELAAGVANPPVTSREVVCEFVAVERGVVM